MQKRYKIFIDSHFCPNVNSFFVLKSCKQIMTYNLQNFIICKSFHPKLCGLKGVDCMHIHTHNIYICRGDIYIYAYMCTYGKSHLANVYILNIVMIQWGTPNLSLQRAPNLLWSGPDLSELVLVNVVNEDFEHWPTSINAGLDNAK